MTAEAPPHHVPAGVAGAPRLPSTTARLLRWVKASRYRVSPLRVLNQPLTNVQLSSRLNHRLKRTCEGVRTLRDSGLVLVLNPEASENRVCWMTYLGASVQQLLYREEGRPLPRRFLPSINWSLYGVCCYRHRRAVLGAIRGSMRAPAIRRRATRNRPDLRMSTNNARDVLSFLVEVGLVSKHAVPRRRQALYSLTHTGRQFQALLDRARECGWRK